MTSQQPAKPACPLDHPAGPKWIRNQEKVLKKDDLGWQTDWKKAEAHRLLAADAHFRHKLGTSHWSPEQLCLLKAHKEHHLRAACNLVDSRCHENAISHYSKPSMVLASKFCNNSSQFRSSLDMNNPAIKKFLQESEKRRPDQKPKEKSLLLKRPAPEANKKPEPPSMLNRAAASSSNPLSIPASRTSGNSLASSSSSLPRNSTASGSSGMPGSSSLPGSSGLSGSSGLCKGPGLSGRLTRGPSSSSSSGSSSLHRSKFGLPGTSRPSVNCQPSKSAPRPDLGAGPSVPRFPAPSSHSAWKNPASNRTANPPAFTAPNWPQNPASNRMTNPPAHPAPSWPTNAAPNRTTNPAQNPNPAPKAPSVFISAHEELLIQEKKKGQSDVSANLYGTSKKTLGVPRSGACASSFKPPIAGTVQPSSKTAPSAPEEPLDERLKNLDANMIEMIKSEIMDRGPALTWSDIAGLEFVKTTVKEMVVFPLLRPDIFTGLRGPPKGLLLFGPPGTGKTLIGKCIASQSKSTFFSISASSLTSKWVGEGEKMVRTLFTVARVFQPSVVFIDEIDSLLSQRSDTEHESSRRMKTEFLVQLDGASTLGEERLLIVGATNRPQDLDEAARRRLVKRLYVPLPDLEARKHIVRNLLASQDHQLSDDEVQQVALKADGYSGADMTNLCKEAAMGPIRSLDYSKIDEISSHDVRPIAMGDFVSAFKQVKASVSQKDLQLYRDWDAQFGCGK